MVWFENEARILYTVEKGFILQSKGGHFGKNSPPHIARRSCFPFFFTHGLYTSNLLSTPMYRHR